MELPKIKIQEFNENDPALLRLKQRNIDKLKVFCELYPYTNAIYAAMQLKLPLSFVKENMPK